MNRKLLFPVSVPIFHSEGAFMTPLKSFLASGGYDWINPSTSNTTVISIARDMVLHSISWYIRTAETYTLEFVDSPSYTCNVLFTVASGVSVSAGTQYEFGTGLNLFLPANKYYLRLSSVNSVVHRYHGPSTAEIYYNTFNTSIAINNLYQGGILVTSSRQIIPILGMSYYEVEYTRGTTFGQGTSIFK